MVRLSVALVGSGFDPVLVGGRLLPEGVVMRLSLEFIGAGVVFRAMQKLSFPSRSVAEEEFAWGDAWSLVEGSPERINVGAVCLDRHSGTAVRLVNPDGQLSSFTFEELSRGANQFARYLDVCGIGMGDRVAVMLNPSFEFFVSFFGTMKRGAVAVPCSELFGPEALSYRIEDSDAQLLVTTSEVYDSLSCDVAVLEKPLLRETITAFTGGYSAETSGEDDAWIQYTSGTTGRPTRVPYQHESCVLFAPVMDFVLDFQPTDSCFTTSSTGWGTGIWMGLFAPLFYGIPTGFIGGAFDPRLVFTAINEFGINTLIGVVPTAYRKLVSAATSTDSTVEKANYVGEPIDSSLSRAVEDTLGAFPRATYGVTEVRSIITIDYAFPDYEFRHGSMGQPLLGVSVTVVDDEGNELPPGEVGVVAVRRAEEWIITEDAAYYDEDGYFWSVGRVDDTIISAGYTIGPQEVEDALCLHGQVSEAGVIGVSDAERGEIVKAFVVLTPGCTAGPSLIEELRATVRERLSKHAYPREIEVVDELPKTPDGKIQRAVLRERETNDSS